MGTNIQKRVSKKILLKDLNVCVTCSLCRGYLVDATTLVECLHSFCRACILRYFENFKSACPTCNVHKKKSNPCFRSDPMLQTLVYKLVPGLYNREVQRREDFYRSTGVRASSSCSEDSVLGDLKEERDEWMLSTNGDENQYLSPDDAISLSLEYYQAHLDTSNDNKNTSGTNSTNQQDSTTNTIINNNNNNNSDPKSSDLIKNSASSSAEIKLLKTCDNNSSNLTTTNTTTTSGDGNGNGSVQKKCDDVKLEPTENILSINNNNVAVVIVTDDNVDGVKLKVKCENGDELSVTTKNTNMGNDRRYLQCPAAVTMSHLQKFLRMKFALSSEHRVDIIHSGEVLPTHFSLIDVAYTFKWQRTKPMRFFYRIFTPAKIQPIKIINTSSVGGKQLQVVPAKSSSPPSSHPKTSESTKEALLKADADAQNYLNKERLMANLQLQSTSKLLLEKTAQASKHESHALRHESHTRHEKTPKKPEEEEGDCIYEYEEPDKDEIRAFAEERDREWALKKQLDQEKEKYRNSKKRKKNKHSKSNLLHKKRKLHAEITSSESLQKEESLKLKVKLTPHNGYKHKHHKSSQQAQVAAAESAQKQQELSSKEKLLQMRQVRHKHIGMDDKSKASISAATPKTTVEEPTDKIVPNLVAVKNNEEPKASASKPEAVVNTPKIATTNNNNNNNGCSELHIKIGEPMKKPPELMVPIKTTQTPISKPTEVVTKSVPKEPITSGKTLRSDFSIKTNATKGLLMQKYPTVQLERNEQTERQAQKTFLKTFQSYTEKFVANQGPSDKNNSNQTNQTMPPKVRPNTYPGRNPANNGPYANYQHHHQQAAKSLEQKIANLHQQCTTIEPKPIVTKIENKPPQILNSHYSASGFTVSKVEAGVKRKPETEHKQDKRPSLEITLINPQPVDNQQQQQTSQHQQPSEVKQPAAKRPLPATIPLERIKKSMNRMPGISIISKPSEKCDNSGALDLSKPNRSLEMTVKPIETPQNKILNGLSLLSGMRTATERADNKNMQLSNLQMLSKVALEHPNLNKSLTSAPLTNKRPQMPSLQTLKIPVPHGSGLKSNLAKLPKLNEINKTQFRVSNAQLRNMRPNQNQSVRDIPNPSLLVRQQNQNRLNSLNSNQGSSAESKEQEVVKQNGVSNEEAGVSKSEIKEKSGATVEEKAQIVTNQVAAGEKS